MSKSFLPQQSTTPPAAAGLSPPGASLVGGDNAFNASLLGTGQLGAFAGGFGLSDARDGMKDALNMRDNEDGKAAVAPVATDLASNPDWWVRLRGHSSKDHRDGVTEEDGAIENMDLARKRTESVHKELGAAGVDAKRFEVENVGEQGATDDPSWRRVDVRPIDNQGMRSAVHEAGHMFGLGDEYVGENATAGDALADPDYSALITAQTGMTITKHDDAGMMSRGEGIEPWHYSTFLMAFKQVTGTSEWAIA